MISGEKSLKNVWNEQKRLKTAKNVFRPAFECAQQPKAGRNTQHTRNKRKGYLHKKTWVKENANFDHDKLMSLTGKG